MNTSTQNITRPSALTNSLLALSNRLAGRLVLPGDEDYEQLRGVWNGMIDRYPAAIAQCADAADVQAALEVVRTFELPVAIRGGGHNVAGFATCDDGLVIDLSPMRSVTVDVDEMTVRAGGGARWGDVDAATQQFGLATPGGVVSDTGIAGLTLGGGFGYLSGKFGLASDNLVSADVVTADGRLLTASETENPDLFWALRGGGGNFGVVTSFTYRLHRFGPEAYVMMTFHDAAGDRAKHVLEAYRDFVEQAPDEMAPLAVLGTFPPTEHFPAELHGKTFVLLLGMYVGPAERGEEAFAPLRELATPLLDASGRMPYVNAQKLLDEDYPARTMRYYWKSAYMDSLPDDAIDVIVEHARQQPSPYSTTDIWHVSGAVTRVPAGATAFAARRTAYLLNPEANWFDAGDDQENMQWVRRTLDAVQAYTGSGRYLNFPGFHEEGEKVVRESFGANFARLAAVKLKYDPLNLFRLNQNVRPHSGNGHE